VQEVVTAPAQVREFLAVFLVEDLDEVGKVVVVVAELFVVVVEGSRVVQQDQPFLFIVAEVLRSVLYPFAGLGDRIDHAR
jgi:hypothetical protein